MFRNSTATSCASLRATRTGTAAAEAVCLDASALVPDLAEQLHNQIAAKTENRAGELLDHKSKCRGLPPPMTPGFEAAYAVSVPQGRSTIARRFIAGIELSRTLQAIELF